MATSTNLDLNADIIDVRDIIARFEEIEDSEDTDDIEEATSLKEIIDELEGMGGDEQWRGDWYPVTLIRDSYFEDYAQELAEDIGAIDRNASWPLQYIDWERAADALKGDYSSLDIDRTTYWTR